MSRIRMVAGLFSVGVMILGAGVVSGQDYPTKPIRIVTTVPGNAVDFAARLMAQGLAGRLGQPVIVENRPGYISEEIVSKALPDGYTLLVAGNPFFYGPLVQKLRYDPVKDFAPISTLASAPQVLVVSPTLPVTSVAELITLAKSKPGVLNYASGGTGGSGHLTAELFKSMAGVDIVRIAYKGTVLAFGDLTTGQVHMMFENAAVAMPFVKAGKMKALAVTSLQPSALIPGLPPVSASLPGFEMLSVNTLFAPANTPETIIKRLNQESVQILNQADVKEKFANTGVGVVGSSPQEAAAWIKTASTSMAKVIKEAGIRVE